MTEEIMFEEDSFETEYDEKDGTIIENPAMQISPKEVIESIKLKDDNELTEIVKPEEIIEPVKVDIKKPTIEISKETKALYDDFNSFLEQKADIKPSAVKLVIPTGIKILDAHLGGGFAIGALTIITGTPGSGKSMLAAQTLANAQRIYANKKFIAGYMDSEESTSKSRLAQLGVIRPQIDPIGNITVEKVFKFLEGMCIFKEKQKIVDIPSVAIWDSIANTLSEKEQEATDVNQVIGYKARMLSILIPKYVSRVTQYNIAFIAINQLRDVLSMGQFGPQPDLKFMSSSKQMPGGQILRFNAFQLLEMGVKSALKSDDGANQKYGIDGIIAKVKVVKNKLFVPNVTIEILGSFVKGFSDFWTSYHSLSESGRLKSGAWNTLVNLPEKKFRTKDAENLYNQDTIFKGGFDEAVNDYIQKDIIDKYSC